MTAAQDPHCPICAPGAGAILCSQHADDRRRAEAAEAEVRRLTNAPGLTSDLRAAEAEVRMAQDAVAAAVERAEAAEAEVAHATVLFEERERERNVYMRQCDRERAEVARLTKALAEKEDLYRVSRGAVIETPNGRWVDGWTYDEDVALLTKEREEALRFAGAKIGVGLVAAVHALRDDRDAVALECEAAREWHIAENERSAKLRYRAEAAERERDAAIVREATLLAAARKITDGMPRVIQPGERVPKGTAYVCDWCDAVGEWRPGMKHHETCAFAALEALLLASEEKHEVTQLFENNCPIRERTGDGVSVGRCWIYCHGDRCERHGDVSKALRLYRETGKLTDENDHERGASEPRALGSHEE